MKAYSYIRFSSIKQEGNDSVRRQTEAISAYCERKSWTIVEQIEDLGVSAWSGAHISEGNLGRFRERVRQGDVPRPAVIVVERLDRISRLEFGDTIDWLKSLCADGVAVAVVEGDHVFTAESLRTDLIANLTVLIRAELANRESTQKSERVLDAIGKNMRRAAAGGVKISAKGPGWLKLSEDRKSWIVIEHRAQVVRDIYSRAAEGQGARWISKEMNQAGIEAFGPPREDGRKRTWEISSVRLLLAQPSVEGTYQPGFSNSSKTKTKFSEPIHGYFPRVVDADLVARARAAVEQRKIGPPTGGRHTAAVANLFTSLAFCRACSSRMHLKAATPTGQRYLQCHHAARRRGCEQREMFNYGNLEAAVLDQVLHLALSDRHFAKVDETGALAVVVAEIEKAIVDGKEKGRRLVKLALLTDDQDEIAAEINVNTRALAVLEKRRVQAQGQLDAARGAVSPDEHLERVRTLRGALQDEDKATRQAARLRVQSAMRAIGLRLECAVSAEGTRETLMMLKTGFVCRIAQDGTVIGRLDMAALADRGEGAEAAAQLLSDATELLVGLREGKIAADWGGRPVDPEFVAKVDTHLRRQREHDAEVPSGHHGVK